MMVRKTGSVAGLAALAVVALQAPAHAGLDVPVLTTFDFAGVCAVGDCTGTGTAQLVLQNYTLGNLFDNSNFVSFTYNGTDKAPSFIIDTSAPYYSASGLINDDLPAAELVTIIGNVGDLHYSFTSSSVGNWSLSIETALDDYGSSSTWAVPEPISLSILGAGLFGLSVVRRQRKA